MVIHVVETMSLAPNSTKKKNIMCIGAMIAIPKWVVYGIVLPTSMGISSVSSWEYHQPDGNIMGYGNTLW